MMGHDHPGCGVADLILDETQSLILIQGICDEAGSRVFAAYTSTFGVH